MPIGHYTARVSNRTNVAHLLKDKYLADAVAAGLKADDLDVIETQGTIAHEADREQHDQMATNAEERGANAATAKQVFVREEAMRDRLPAVVREVAVTDPKSAGWLRRLTFARYRFRELAAPAAPATAPDAKPADAPAALTAEEVAEVKSVERVARADMPTRLDGLGAFCAALLKKGREPIVAALTSRGFDQAMIAALGADADAAAKHGRNSLPAAEATARESDAVIAQRDRWNEVLRMIKAVARKHPDVASKLADC